MKRMQYALIAYGLIILALAMRLLGIARSMEIDEPLTIELAQKPIAHFAAFLINNEAHPPLTAFLVKGWMSMGRSVVWIRFLCVLMGMIACWGMYRVGKYYGGRLYGIFCLLLMSCAPLAVWTSTYIRSYIFAAAAVTWSLYFFLKIITDPEKKYVWGAFAAVMLAALYSFYITGLLLIAYTAVIGVYWRRYRVLRVRWMCTVGGIGIGIIPLLPILIGQLQRVSGNAFVVAREGFYVGPVHVGALIRTVAGLCGIDPFFMHGALAKTMPLWMLGLFTGVTGCVGIMVFAVGIVYARNRSVSQVPVPSGVFPLLIGIPFVMMHCMHHYIGLPLLTHYMMPFVPVFICFFAGVFMMMPRMLRVICFSGYIVFSICRLPIIATAQEDWKNLARYFSHECGVSDRIIIFGDLGRFPLSYYGGDALSKRMFSMDKVMRSDPLSDNVCAHEYRFALKNVSCVWVMLVPGWNEQSWSIVFDRQLQSWGFRPGKMRSFSRIMVRPYRRMQVAKGSL